MPVPAGNLAFRWNSSTTAASVTDFVQAPNNNGTTYGAWYTDSGGNNIGRIYDNGQAAFKSFSPGTLAGAVQVSNKVFQGSGAPGTGLGVTATAGDIYFRTDTPSTVNQRIYICTTGGASGAQVWAALVSRVGHGRKQAAGTGVTRVRSSRQ
jgi:hypothetical protein